MPTALELTAFRKRNQRTKYYLAVHRPASLFSSKIAVTPDTYPASAVTIDAGFNVGDATLTSKNMTVWIGALPGGSEEGRVRLREPMSGTVMSVAESGCALVRYTVGKFVTIIDEFYPWPKLPRYITSASQWRMDYDETYTDELENYPPVIRMGPPFAGFIDGGALAASFVGGSTQYISSTATTHEWVFPDLADSNIIGTETCPITRTFTGASPGGSYFTYIATDSNGQSTSGHRLIYAFGDRTDPAQVEFAQISGGLKKGGYQGTLRVVSGGNTDQFPDGAEILIFEEASYAGTASTIGGNYPFRSNIVARGWINEDTTTINPFSGDVTFKFTTIDGYLDKTYSKDIFHKNANPPTGTSEWVEAAQLSIDRVAIDWLHNRSTVGAITDFTLASGIPMTAKIAFQDLPKSSLWKQIKTNYGDKGTRGYVASDMQGNIHAMEDVQISGLSANLATSRGMTIEVQDRREVVTIAHPHLDKNALVQMFSVAEDEYAESDTAGKQGYIGARSPGGDAYGYFGGTKEHARGLVTDEDPATGQQLLTTWSGNWRAKLNSRYPKVIVPMSGNIKFDSVPQKRVTMSLSATENVRGLDWSNKSFLPYKTTLTFDSTTGTAMTDIELEETTDGKGGSAITFERIVPMSPQPAPTPPPLTFSSGSIIVFNNSLGAYSHYTSWDAINGGLTGTNIQDRHGARTSNRILYKTDSSKIYKSEDYGTTWGDVTPTADPTGSDASAVDYIRYKPDLTDPTNHYFLARNDIAGTWKSWMLHIDSSTSAETWQAITGQGGTGTSVAYYTPTSAVLPVGSSETNFEITGPTANVAKFDATHGLITYIGSTGDAWVYGNAALVSGTSVSTGPYDTIYDAPTHDVAVANVNSTQTIFFARESLGSVGWAKSITLSGDTALTFTANEQRVTPNDANFINVDGVGASEAVFLWEDGTTNTLKYRKGEISAGGSLTLRNAFDLGAPTADAYEYSAVVSLNSTYQVAVAGVRNDTGQLHTYLIEMQGQSAVNYGPFVASAVNIRYRLNLVKLSASRIGIIYWDNDDSGSKTKIIIGTHTATSMTFGAPKAFPANIINNLFDTARIQDDAFIHTTWLDTAQEGFITTVATTTGGSVDFGAYHTGNTDGDINAWQPKITMLDSTHPLTGFVDYNYSGTADSVRVVAGSIVGSGQSDASALGLAVGNAGTKGYVTYHDGTNLAVNEYTLPGLTLGNTTTLGAATTGQVEANTYTAYPHTTKLADSLVYVSGRMAAPAGLGSDPTHIIKSEDSAATFSLVEDGFGSDYVPMVMRRGGPSSGREGNNVYAIRNYNNVIGVLYIGASTLSNQGLPLPFGIHNEGAYMTSGGYIIAGASEPTADMVRYTASPYTRWYRLKNYPDTGEITGITVLSNKT